MDFQIVNDIKGLGIKDIFDLYSSVNSQKIARGALESQNYVDKIKAEAELYNAQALKRVKESEVFSFNNKWLMWGVVAGLGVVAYKLIK